MTCRPKLRSNPCPPQGGVEGSAVGRLDSFRRFPCENKWKMFEKLCVKNCVETLKKNLFDRRSVIEILKLLKIFLSQPVQI